MVQFGSDIKVKNLQFGYGKNIILKGINLEIKPGSFLSIIGPNGSGKSTLLKNISKSVLPQKGDIELDSINLLSMKPRQIAQRMAVVPQDTTIEFSFSVYETVLMGRTPFLGRFESEGPKDFALARWAMEITNIWHLKDRSVTEISGGERQRVVVARALAQEPRVILLDEPTAHLDIQHQVELLELLQSLNRTTGLTVVAVLHDLNLAAQFSEHVVLMKDGKIFAEGSPDQVLTPANIRKVYSMEVAITDNPLTGRFNVIPLGRTKSDSKGGKGLHVHLICGGGTGIFILDRLVQLGYKVSCGILNIGDTDWSRAKMLGVEVVEEAPFAPIGEKSLSMNRALIQKANYIIITPIPFGKGNLANLQLSAEACQTGKPVLIMANDFEKRDFTEGHAQRLLEEMKQAQGVFVNTPQEIFEFLEKYN
ncbi:ABC transporter ATP-binding protein [Desulfitibacter alkalitolerans]|uniref:ABC transporter ATP-binding protein n=1 Tax=Desulfitibacter alkalitolerans TaxID=264641 RepID=UPI0004853CF6|nr:ABC transporter ATP-binding protein [Desulfitibacter alkalitolerans]